jgi:DNA-binding transcriptional LysR family regulator
MPLLRRTTRRLSMTEVGRDVFAAASRGLFELEEAEAVVVARRETPSGQLRIAAPYSFGVLSLEPIVRAFQAAFPAVRVELALTNEPIDLATYDFDLAIRAESIPDSPYVARPLFRGGVVVVATPGFVDRCGRLDWPHDLGSHSLGLLSGPVFTAGRNMGASQVLRFRRDEVIAEVAVAPSLASNEPLLLLAHALSGAGPSVLYDVLCQEHIDKGDLVVLLDDWRIDATLELSLIYERRSTRDPKIRAFITFIVESMRHRKGYVPSLDEIINKNGIL